MVRNEKDPRGDSIAERFGRPVTASDVEDLLYAEGVRSGTVAKVMAAVRQAISWQHAKSLRPWAGDLEDGLTRQEDRRRADRRAAEAAAQDAAQEARSATQEAARALLRPSTTPDPLRAPQAPLSPVPDSVQDSAYLTRMADLRERLLEERRGAGAAAADRESPEVNTAGEGAEQVATVGAADRAPQDAPGRPAKAPVSVSDRGARPITLPAPSEAPRAVSEPRDEEPEPEETLDDVFSELREQLAAGVVAGGAADGAARPAGGARDVGDGAAGATPPPAPREAPRGRSEPHKVCTRCGGDWPLTFYQRDKRASDKRRGECKQCSAASEAIRRSLRLSAKAAADQAAAAGAEAQRQADLEAEAISASASEQPQPLAPVSYLRVVPPPEPEASTPAELRVCKKCDLGKDAAEFYTRKDGRVRYVCKACERAESAARREAARGF